jgi:uncharacterized protein (TIGR03437 family)
MQRKRRLFVGKTAAIMGAIPLLIWASASGPQPGSSGAPGELTCNQAQCHVGTNVNAGGGSVKVTFPNGTVYVPGVKQHLVVTVADPANTQRVWGFQLTARLVSNSRTMAGTFTATDRFTALMCASSPTDQNYTFVDFPSTQSCATSKPYTYIEHSPFGTARLQTGSMNYEFDWTPPATNVGNVVLYVAGNAANGNSNETGDHIYTASYTLTPGTAGATPTIESGGVQNGASFQPGIVPNGWITVKGTNLSPTTATWESAIVNGNLPTTLGGVGVKVGGKDAYIYYVSPTQINALAPDVGTGSMSVTVSTPTGTSAAFTATSNSLMPAFFLLPGNQAVATHIDGTLAIKNGTYAGVTTVPAKPGEYVILWGTGFGPTTPPIPVGKATPSGQIYSTSNTVSVTVNGASADVYGSTASLAPGSAGLYQLAVQIPANAPDGDLPVIATVAGAQSPTGVVVTVKR